MSKIILTLVIILLLLIMYNFFDDDRQANAERINILKQNKKVADDCVEIFGNPSHVFSHANDNNHNNFLLWSSHSSRKKYNNFVKYIVLWPLRVDNPIKVVFNFEIHKYLYILGSLLIDKYMNNYTPKSLGDNNIILCKVKGANVKVCALWFYSFLSIFSHEDWLFTKVDEFKVDAKYSYSMWIDIRELENKLNTRELWVKYLRVSSALMKHNVGRVHKEGTVLELLDILVMRSMK